ncbi:hypothetical protein EJB05_10098, partial [Eragrostis curvula]
MVPSRARLAVACHPGDAAPLPWSSRPSASSVTTWSSAKPSGALFFRRGRRTASSGGARRPAEAAQVSEGSAWRFGEEGRRTGLERACRGQIWPGARLAWQQLGAAGMARRRWRRLGKRGGVAETAGRMGASFGGRRRRRCAVGTRQRGGHDWRERKFSFSEASATAEFVDATKWTEAPMQPRRQGPRNAAAYND